MSSSGSDRIVAGAGPYVSRPLDRPYRAAVTLSLASLSSQGRRLIDRLDRPLDFGRNADQERRVSRCLPYPSLADSGVHPSVSLVMLRSLRDTVVQFGVVGPVALFTGLGPLIGAIVLTATAPLWLDAFLEPGAARVPAFLLLTAVLAGYSLIPTHASSLLGGMAFGVGIGSAMALCGTALAAALGFVTLRFLLRAKVVDALSHHPRAEAIHRELDQGHGLRTMALLALIRLSPVVPFAATNLLMSTTGVRLLPFLISSMVGLAPRIVAVVWIGSSLTELDLSQAADRRLLVLGIVATVAALWILGRASRRGLARLERA